MTLDLGFDWTELADDTGGTGDVVAFVDVPGHERFVTIILAGVGPAPAVMFVVAADEGWMPQSAEHLDALGALGTRHGLLVITRCDLMDPELALGEAREHLAASALGPLPSVCVSGTTGAGLDELRVALSELAERLPLPDVAADVRLWVDRAFTVRGAGTVVTDTLAAGRLSTGDELTLEPGGRRVTVRGLQSLGEPVPDAAAVARVAVNLRGLPREAARRGDVLVAPGRWLRRGAGRAAARAEGPGRRSRAACRAEPAHRGGGRPGAATSAGQRPRPADPAPPAAAAHGGPGVAA